MEALAKLKNYPTSPRKMRLVADLIRGKSVEEAMNIVKFHSMRTYALPIEKLLLSAVSNWQVINEDSKVEKQNLFVRSILVDGAKQLKRIRPAPQGRAHRIRKRSNHVIIVIDSKNTENIISE